MNYEGELWIMSFVLRKSPMNLRSLRFDLCVRRGGFV